MVNLWDEMIPPAASSMKFIRSQKFQSKNFLKISTTGWFLEGSSCNTCVSWKAWKVAEVDWEGYPPQFLLDLVVKPQKVRWYIKCLTITRSFMTRKEVTRLRWQRYQVISGQKALISLTTRGFPKQAKDGRIYIHIHRITMIFVTSGPTVTPSVK